MKELTDDKILKNIEPTKTVVNQKLTVEFTSVSEAINNICEAPYHTKIVLYKLLGSSLALSERDCRRLLEALLIQQDVDYMIAFLFCKYAISKFEYSLEFYTDMLMICAELDDPFLYGKPYLDKISCVKNVWSRQLYKAVFYFYATLVSRNILQNEKRLIYYEEARKIAKEMQALFYGEEYGFWAEAILLLLVGLRKQAREHLEKLFFFPLNTEKDSSRYLRCPHCCKLWIEEFREYSGSLDRFEAIVDKGLFDTDADDIELYLFFKQQKDNILLKAKALKTSDPVADDYIKTIRVEHLKFVKQPLQRESNGLYYIKNEKE